MRRALIRFGGAVVAPRATAAQAHPDEGERDGVWLSLLYVGATSVYGVIEGLANLMATRNTSGLLMVLSSVGRALILPIVTLVIVEAILGATRAHRRGMCLVPTLAVVLVMRHLPWRAAVGWPYLPEALGLLAAIGLALWMRPAIPEVRGVREVGS